MSGSKKVYPRVERGPTSTKSGVKTWSDTYSWFLVDLIKGKEWLIKWRLHGQPVGSVAEFGDKPSHWLDEYRKGKKK
jgi:hypothetical protein